jgi:hypothetical protein
MQYEIFNQATGNLVDIFSSEREALEMVREVLNEGGIDAVRSWSLGSLDAPGHAVAGTDLIIRAEQLSAPGVAAGD